MSNEELVALIRSGERDKLLPLWAQVRRFALWQARRWAATGRGGVTADDLLQEAFLALVDALEGWKEGSGSSFLAWYALRLKAAFTAATRQRTQRDRLDPLRNCLSLDAPLVDSDGEAFTLEDVVPDPAAERAVEDIAEHDFHTHRRTAVRRALDGLPADQRRAVVLRYWRGSSADTRALNAGLRALRHPSVSLGLRAFLA